MTSGTIGSQPTSGILKPHVQSLRTWSGADGKYESYGGGTRLKWNNLSSTRRASICTQRYVYLRGLRNSNNSVITGTYVPSIAGSPSTGAISNTAKSKALQKILEKVKGHDFNLAVELGQMNQTVDLLAGNLRKLGRAALALRRGDIANAARQLGARPRTTRLKASDISGRWLELQYGWLPLLGTCFESAKAFEAISSGPRSKIFKAATTEPVTVNLSQSPSHYSAFMQGKRVYRLQYEMYEEMSVARQLGMVDPFSVAWELTPWSFVIDWFLPFGEYLSNLSQIPALKGRWMVTEGYKFAMHSLEWAWLLDTYPVSGTACHNVTAYLWPDKLTGATVYTRAALASPPKVPFPNFNLQGVNSSKRFWNAVSLAHQRFLK